MGKTCVAIAAANQATEYFKDGVCFVELGHVEDAERTANALAVALGLSVRSANSVFDIIGFLQTRQMLILVDGCEHVINPIATLLEKIVAITVAVHILATSREALRIEFEQVFHLEPLASSPLDKNLSAAEILAYPATQLFIARARATTRAISVEEESELIAYICSRLDGLALAIELAASQAHAFGLAGLADMLEKRSALEWTGRRTAPARHRTLGAMLEWSYRLLTEIEKRVFRYLSVFSGRFDMNAAKAMVEMDISGIEIAIILTDLASKSLLTINRSETGTRYCLLDTTRIYARDKLAEAGEFDELRRRHASFYKTVLEG
jgi:predicted ATPase